MAFWKVAPPSLAVVAFVLLVGAGDAPILCLVAALTLENVFGFYSDCEFVVVLSPAFVLLCWAVVWLPADLPKSGTCRSSIEELLSASNPGVIDGGKSRFSVLIRLAPDELRAGGFPTD